MKWISSKVRVVALLALVVVMLLGVAVSVVRADGGHDWRLRAFVSECVHEGGDIYWVPVEGARVEIWLCDFPWYKIAEGVTNSDGLAFVGTYVYGERLHIYARIVKSGYVTGYTPRGDYYPAGNWPSRLWCLWDDGAGSSPNCHMQ